MSSLLVTADGLFCPLGGCALISQHRAPEPNLYYCTTHGLFRIEALDVEAVVE